MGEEKKRLPVGVENFELIINDNYYYVDKTGLISELLRNGGMVNLFTVLPQLSVNGIETKVLK